MRSVIRDCADDGTTVFFSSHILSEVEAVCDRVGVMNDGKLVAIDTIENLRKEAGGRASIELECATDPPTERLVTLDGVDEVIVEETTLTVHCTDPTIKADVVRHVDDRVDVVDILADNTSLEELFNQYTNGGRDGAAEDAVDDGSQEASA